MCTMSILLPLLVAIAATSDDLIYLSAFYIEGTRNYKVITGELLGFTSLALISLLISGSLPHLHLLGLLPVCMGVTKLIGLDEAGKTNRGSSLISVYLTNLSCGANNLALFIPLFATTNPIPILISCYLCIGLWLYLSKKVGNSKLKNYLYKVSPFIYIGVGLKVLLLSQ